MKHGRTVEDALADMLDAAEKAVAFCGAMPAPEFAADDKTAFAVIHALAILGGRGQAGAAKRPRPPP